jgi:hypothetical protein
VTTTPDGPPIRRSHSQLGIVNCPKRYQLERREGVTPVPAWYAIGGSAVHAVIETWLRDQARLERETDEMA